MSIRLKLINPNISIVIPVYNSENFLDQCLCSLLTQTLSLFELIIVDDGSTDGSVKKIISYMQRDSRIHLYSQKHQGPGFARNLALKQATGKYLLFLDSDDFFEQDMLEKLYNKAEETKADVLFYWYDKFDNKTQSTIKVKYNSYLNKIPWNISFDPKEYDEFLFQLSGGEAWKYLFRSDFVKKNHFEFGKTFLGEDSAFTYPARAMAKSMCFLDKTFVHYRINTKEQLTCQNHLKRELKKSYKHTWKKLKECKRHQALKNSFNERKKMAKIWLKKKKKNP